MPYIDVPVSSGDHTAIGRWGEALVYQYLLLSRPKDTVEWVNLEVHAYSFSTLSLLKYVHNRSVVSIIE